MSRALTALGLLATFAACEQRRPPSTEVSASELPAIRINAARGEKLLFTYRDTSGVFETVAKLDDVPTKARAWVRVVDLALKPDQRKDHRLVYVADLRKAAKDGSYPYLVVSRRAFETAAAGRASAPDIAAATTGGVILYSTDWCPACRSARSWMKEKKITFVEKDIEKDKRAAAELMLKAQKAGVSPSGVPVIDVNGTLVQGFDAARIMALLGGK